MEERPHLEELSTEERLLSKWISKNGALNALAQVKKLQSLAFEKTAMNQWLPYKEVQYLSG
jgi:hypothetical protein